MESAGKDRSENCVDRVRCHFKDAAYLGWGAFRSFGFLSPGDHAIPRHRPSKSDEELASLKVALADLPVPLLSRFSLGGSSYSMGRGEAPEETITSSTDLISGSLKSVACAWQS